MRVVKQRYLNVDGYDVLEVMIVVSNKPLRQRKGYERDKLIKKTEGLGIIYSGIYRYEQLCP